jgi:hypothetical protein
MMNNIPNTALEYRNKPVFRGLSYATVEDFVDSYDNLPHLATRAGDLKDVQRPWAFKTICSLLPPGSRLCEVGAGEPVVASCLAKAGYDVTIVDPYNGSGNGPREFDKYIKDFPHLKFHRQNFRFDLQGLEASSFDGIYSISVIKHIPFAGIDSFVKGSAKYLKKGGFQNHAIDLVVAGSGDQYHKEMLAYFLQNYDISKNAIESLVDRALIDTETYFLSAEAHNRWRGKMAYPHFPMRKVISAQFTT